MVNRVGMVEWARSLDAVIPNCLHNHHLAAGARCRSGGSARIKVGGRDGCRGGRHYLSIFPTPPNAKANGKYVPCANVPE
jgi:hypothetical protein